MPPWERYAAQPAQVSQGGRPWEKYASAPKTQPVNRQEEAQSLGRTVLDQGMQGATFGFSDEVTDPLGATIAAARENPIGFAKAIFTGKTPEVSDELSQEILGVRDMSKQRMQQQFEQNPATSIASNIGGALLTGGAGATTKAGAATANMLRGGNLAARIGKGAAAGAASGALYGSGTSDDGERLEGAGRGAVLGAVTGGAIPAVGVALKSSARGAGNIIKGATARSVEQLDDVSNALRQKSGAAYQVMRDTGAVFKPETSQAIVSKIDDTLKSDGILNHGLHGKTMSVLDDMRSAAKANDFGLEQLDQWRQLLGEVVSDGTDKIKGVSADARKAQLVIRRIDDIVNGLDSKALVSGNTKAVDALRGARAEWAKARRFESVANIIKKSDGDANYLKRELKKLADDPRRTRGWNIDEIAALREASRLSAGEGIMKMLGKFGFDLGNSRIGSGVGALVGSGAGGVAAGGSGAVAAPIVGTAARYGQKAIGRGKAETLLNVIEGTARLPRVQQAISPVLSAPAGAVSGAISGVESQAPRAIQPAIQPTMGQPLPPRSEAPQSDLMTRIAQAESGGNPNAKNPNSSASGLYQFTNDTWNASVQRWGKELGIKHGDKNKPEAQEKMVRKLTESNAQYIEKNLGIQPNDGQIYLAHFMGAPAAVKLMKHYGTGASAAQIFPKQAKANQSIFFDANGRARTIEQVYQILTQKVGVA